jgi:hypothetical protein
VYGTVRFLTCRPPADGFLLSDLAVGFRAGRRPTNVLFARIEAAETSAERLRDRVRQQVAARVLGATRRSPRCSEEDRGEEGSGEKKARA